LLGMGLSANYLFLSRWRVAHRLLELTQKFEGKHTMLQFLLLLGHRRLVVLYGLLEIEFLGWFRRAQRNSLRLVALRILSWCEPLLRPWEQLDIGFLDVEHHNFVPKISLNLHFPQFLLSNFWRFDHIKAIYFFSQCGSSHPFELRPWISIYGSLWREFLIWRQEAVYRRLHHFPWLCIIFSVALDNSLFEKWV